ncbi:MAG: TAT-variant-translocated molybdopterin oxidoreductase [Planctomycetota bacterium]
MTRSESTTDPKPTYWRSISELHGNEEFKTEYLHREFPVAASEFPEGVSRRRWMQIMGASLAMAGVAGCRYPEEIIAPFVIRPEGRVPGEKYLRATNFELAGRVHNLVVECFDGRPLQVMPNTEHPSSAGTDTYVQAAMLALYDPDRSRGDDGPVLKRTGDRKQETDWAEAIGVSSGLIDAAAKKSGEGFALMFSPTSSPTLVRMLKKLREKLPSGMLVRYDGVGNDVMRQATSKMFGVECSQELDLTNAKVVLSLGADILGSDPGALLASKTFATNRDALQGPMSRLYVVEAGYSTTGTMADTRLALRPSQMPAFLGKLERAIEAAGTGSHESPQEEGAFDTLEAAERLERFLDCAAHDIAAAGSEAVIVVDESLGPDVVAAGIAINEKLGSLGKIQKFSPRVDAGVSGTVGLGSLVDAVSAGSVESLVILGDNPVIAAPGDVDFASLVSGVKNTIYLGEYDDETAVLCDWSLPLAHPLESWSDCVNAHGYYGVCQPQILPLMGGRTAAEFVALMLGEAVNEPMALVRETAAAVLGSDLGEGAWRRLLHDGYSESVRMKSTPLAITGEAAPLPTTDPVVVTADSIDKDDFEILFTVSEGTYDGRFANNGWLQELPQPITKLTWGNAAVVSPATAKMLGIKHGLTITLRKDGAKMELPVFEIPGLAHGVVETCIGYGRTRAGMVGGFADYNVDIVGIDVSPLRRSDSMMIAYGVEARPNFTDYDFSTTQDHWAIDELGKEETKKRSRTLVREGTPALLEKVPTFAREQPNAMHVPKVGKYGSLNTEPIAEIELDEEQDFVPQWGMSIDLSKCTGCNACVVACQSENNVPIVGPEQVRNSREMHWLRIDRYFQGNEENADVVHQPLMCLHCETAPCEQVCPVAATVHTNEGINAMAYNRCIGTRYCANNCPVKVRRFNYFNYNKDVGVGYGIDAYPGSIEKANRKLQSMVLNPEVTVRGRGVMEKCTFCVQRVEAAKIKARKEGGRPIRDGDVVTACQAACSTSAIEFGNLADPDSAVSKRQADPRSYGLLEQLNIKARAEYLARIRNPHPRLMSTKQINDLATIESHHGHGDHGDHGDHDGDHHEDHAEEGHADGHDHDHEEQTHDEKH